MSDNQKKNEGTLRVSAADTVFTGDSVTGVDITGSIRTITDAAGRLDTTLIGGNFLEKYNGAITAQQGIITSALDASTRLHLEGSRITEMMSTIVAPTSSIVSGIGLASANIGKLVEAGSIIGNSLDLSRNMLSLSLETIERQQIEINHALRSVTDSGALRALEASSLSISSVMIGSGMDTILRSIPSYSLDTVPEAIETEIEVVREVSEIADEKLPEYEVKLDAMLSEVDPDLVKFRMGAWETLRGKGKDHIGQAASSMRRLVDQLLRTIAPIEKAEKTEYFKNEDSAKDNNGRPTRKARVLAAVNYDQKKAAYILQLTDDLLGAHKNLSAWDHEPIEKDDLVYGIFLVIEGHLIALLAEKKA